MNQKISRRNIYYSNKIQEKKRPDEFLYIIDDEMDKAKTGIPRLATKIKKLKANVISLPKTLTGMLTHGRHPRNYGHFSVIGLWPGDSDFTIISLVKYFHNLKGYVGNMAGDLKWTNISSMNENYHPIFSSLLDSSYFKASYSHAKGLDFSHFSGQHDMPMTEGGKEAQSSTHFKKLLRHLCLQMDNSGKDNKNSTVMAYAFCSELVYREVFETVEMSFFMVWHTHEDIDAFLSKVSQRYDNIPVTDG